MRALFGPAGNSDSFSAKGYKNNKEVPLYIKEMGLDAYEYQCGHGVRINQASAEIFKKMAVDNGIVVSLHAPYYISLSSVEEEKRQSSIKYITNSAVAAKAIGANRIIVHSGSCAKISREEALELAKQTLKDARDTLVEMGLGDIHICPETMGKFNQLGDLDEVMELCRVDDSFIPCVDFGHLNARTLGEVNSKESFKAILNKIEDCLGIDRLKVFHSHFSKIEYTQKGGEKKHLTFEDELYGPEFEPLAELIAVKGLTPIFICESAGTQAEDAQFMKACYNSFTKE